MNNDLKHHCVMGNDYYQANEHYVAADGKTRSSGEVFGYAVITHQYYNRYRPPPPSRPRLQETHQETHRCVNGRVADQSVCLQAPIAMPRDYRPGCEIPEREAADSNADSATNAPRNAQ